MAPPAPEACCRRGVAFVEARHRRVRTDQAAADLDRLSTAVAGAPGSLAARAGDFGFLWFDPDGSALVVRSCAGRVPLDVWSDGDSVAVAALQRDLVRLLPGALSIDALSHATWATRCCFTPDDRTFVANARLLPEGHCARVAPGPPARFVRYWDPGSVCAVRIRAGWPSTAPPSGAARRRPGRGAPPDGGNLLSLSGGVDSASIGAALRRRRAPPTG